MSQLSTSGYGLTPRVISSHTTTPYDHYTRPAPTANHKPRLQRTAILNNILTVGHVFTVIIKNVKRIN